jgi:hypothetical protein
MRYANSLDGIISYLTKKHGGNVQEKRIIAITSMSVYEESLENIADLTSDPYFYSEYEPRQWVCWDFREMRIRPTHCTIKTQYLESWVVDGSLDGRCWTVIDWKADNRDFANTWNTASFAVSTPAEFRMIRLTQTGTNGLCDHQLAVGAVELFGTLSE